MTASRLRNVWFGATLAATVLVMQRLPAQISPTATSGPGLPQASPGLPQASSKQRDAAEQAYLTGAKHLRDGDFKTAETDFARAVSLDPARPEYVGSLMLAREHHVTALLQQAAGRRPADPAAADRLIAEARSLDSTNPQVMQHETPRLNAGAVPPPIRTELAGPLVLAHNGSRHSYHERSSPTALATELARDYGFRVVVEAEVPQQPVRLDVDDIGYDDAVSIFQMMSKTMLVPLDAHSAILAQDTAQNRTRLERMSEETFYLPGFAADQMKDFVSIAQTIFDMKQVVAQPLQGAIVVRGPADRVDAVEKVFADLLQDTSDVVIDVKLYEVDKLHVRNLGIVLPQSLSGYSVAAEAQSIVSGNSTLIAELQSAGVLSSTASSLQIAEYLVLSGLVSNSLITNSFLIVGGGATTVGLTVGNAPTLDLALTDSDARTLDDVQLRASDRQAVKFTTGLRYPIQTSLFSNLTSSTASSITVNGVSLSSLLASYLGTSGSTGSVAPQIQYEDLGLTVTTTPRIQRNAEVGMHLEVKVTALTGTSLNGLPILDSRQFSSDLTLRDGDTAMMVSDVSDEEIAAVTGVPGISEVPGFQNTTNHNGTKSTGDLVLMVTPHIVRLGHPGGRGPYIPVRNQPDND